MQTDSTGEIVIIMLYGWPILIGVGCFIVSSRQKVLSFIFGTLKACLCMFVAALLSGVMHFGLESWLVTYSNRIQCIERTPECDLWVLYLGDWLTDWQFIVLVVLAFICAVILAVKQTKAFKK